MGKWSASDIGVVITPGATDRAYYPQVIDVTALGWPCDYVCIHSTDHAAGGIYLHVCTGDPSSSGNWKSYDQALSDGDFDAVSPKASSNPIYNPSGVGSSVETPHANYIGGTWYMMTHQFNVPGADGQQSTTLGTGSGAFGLLNLSVYETPIMLDYDPMEYPGDGHTGYFRWGVKPSYFTEIDYTYIGYSLHGGTDYSHNALWGSDDIVRWTRIAILDRECDGLGFTSSWAMQSRLHDVSGITDDGFAILMVAEITAGGSFKKSELYQAKMSRDGLSIISRPELLLAQNDGTFNEAITSYSIAEYSGQKYLFYTATNASNENTVGVASLSTVSDAVPVVHTPKRGAFPNRLYHDFVADQSLPSWLEEYHTGAAFSEFDATDGLRLKSAASGGTAPAAIRTVDTFTPSDCERLCIRVYGSQSSSAGKYRYPHILFIDDNAYPSSGNQMRVNTFVTPNGIAQMTHRVSASNTVQENTKYDWGYGDNEAMSEHPVLGLDWHVDAGKVQFIAGDGLAATYEIEVGDGLDDLDLYAMVAVGNDGDFYIKAIEILWGRYPAVTQQPFRSHVFRG